MAYQANRIRNRVKMVSDYFAKTPTHTLYPQEVVIELTNHCNLSCVMCPHNHMSRPKGFMDELLFRKIVDEIKKHTELIYLYGAGESLIHAGLYDFTHYACQNGLATCLSTNGLLIDEKAAERLLTSGLDFLIIALDGGVKETYEKIRIKGNFDLLIHNIVNLLDIQSKLSTKTHICLQMIYMEENSHEIALFKRLFTKRQKQFINQFRFKPLFETYATHDRAITHTKPCYWLWNMMSVTWNGTVNLCCMDFDAAHDFGNLSSDTVKHIWNSESLKKLRRQHKMLNFEELNLCKSCDIPEQGYFSNANILGSAFLSASQIRKLIPMYERLFLTGRGT